MALSTQTVVSDGTLTQLSLSIDFVTRSSIKVFFDTSEQTLGTTWSWVGTTGNTIAFSPAVPNAVVIIVRRGTDLSAPLHIFNAGAQFNEASLDANFTQVLHSAQESSEGATVKESFNNFDMHLNRITSLGDAIASGDAVNKGQLDTITAGATAASVASAASAGASAISAASALASANSATSSASSATSSASSATASAAQAAASAESIDPSLLVKWTGATGSVKSAVGTTAQRDVVPAIGWERFNTTLGYKEVWNGSVWVAMAIVSTVATDIAAAVAMHGVQVGTILTHGGGAIPSGYLQVPVAVTNVSRTTYSALFAQINTLWGAGDGTTTFGIPYCPADMVFVQGNGSVGVNTVGAILSHTHRPTFGGNPSTTTSVYSNTSNQSLGAGASNMGLSVLGIEATGGAANLPAGMRSNYIVKY